MNEQFTICISTYNGIDYFDDQITSILDQSYPNYKVIIRDDGSTDDNFLEKLTTYCNKYPQIDVIYGQNIGVTRSFFELLKYCPTNSDYIVLSDQDDVWHLDRLQKTYNFLSNKNTEKPLLSFCRLEYVDENLNHISNIPKYTNVGFKNALVQNLAPGCTICINKAALAVVISHIPKKPVIHDWWIYLVISGIGEVFQEPHISVKYRQHKQNVLGGSTSFIKKSRKRIKNKLNHLILEVYQQVEEFYSEYSLLISKEKCKSIEQFLQTNNNFRSKICFLFNFSMVRRENFLDNILLRLVVLFSKPSNKL